DRLTATKLGRAPVIGVGALADRRAGPPGQARRLDSPGTRPSIAHITRAEHSQPCTCPRDAAPGECPVARPCIAPAARTLRADCAHAAAQAPLCTGAPGAPGRPGGRAGGRSRRAVTVSAVQP